MKKVIAFSSMLVVLNSFAMHDHASTTWRSMQFQYVHGGDDCLAVGEEAENQIRDAQQLAETFSKISFDKQRYAIQLAQLLEEGDDQKDYEPNQLIRALSALCASVHNRKTCPKKPLLELSNEELEQLAHTKTIGHIRYNDSELEKFYKDKDKKKSRGNVTPIGYPFWKEGSDSSSHTS